MRGSVSVRKYFKGLEIKVENSKFTLQEHIEGDKWVLTCSECSKDEELWPYGSIHTRINNLVRGNIPCGCSKFIRLKEWQSKIVVERQCKLRGYKFLGWKKEYENKLKTGIVLFDEINKVNTEVCNISSFLAGRDGISRASQKIRDNKIKDLSYYEDLFLRSGSFKMGTIFIRKNEKDVSGRFLKWEYICPVCSHDEYVKAGLCSGRFSSSFAGLKEGRLSCRCSTNPKWDLNKREFQIRKIIKEENLEWVGWVDTTLIETTSHYKFEWVCNKGHLNCTNVNNFLKGRRCSDPFCKYSNSAIVNNYGVYEGREGDEDNLYIIRLYNENESFIKIGRSFNPKMRFSSIHRFYKIEVIRIIKGSHLEVVELEGNLHKKLMEFHYTPDISFKGSVFECFNLSALDSEFLNCQIDKNN